MNNWTDKDSPRIWRTPESNFYGDEPLQALEVYTDDKLAQIASHGFNAVWLRGRLYDLMRSSVFPELNRLHARQRMDNLLGLIQRAKVHGIDVYLFFNEPLALTADDPFWLSHTDIKGQPYRDPMEDVELSSLCISTVTVRQFFKQAVQSILSKLAGLGGVILITASEHHSHCWSHYIRYGLSDGVVEKSTDPMQCPRCREREPADIVTDLLRIWSEVANQITPRPKVIAWNWSWSIWYPDPQAQVVDMLPDGVELQLDWERGGSKRMFGRDITMDEYSLGYAGPSERCKSSLECARRSGIAVHAKLQVGTTHEIATVPNLPLMQNLHAKFSGLYREGISGLMGCWNFGCSLTLNTFALGLFCSQPKQRLDRQRFLNELAQEYFGSVDSSLVTDAWAKFGEAFEHFPFSIRMLYWGPNNYAPAYPLVSDYRDEAMGPSWIGHHPFGDRLEDCIGPFSIDEVIQAYDPMSGLWDKGLADYRKALSSTEGGTEEQLRHRFEELSCADMISCHLKSASEIFRFHRWRLGVIAAQGLQPPCKVPLDAQAVEIMERQIGNAKEALKLAKADARLGFHQEPQARFYDPQRIQIAIDGMYREITAADQ